MDSVLVASNIRQMGWLQLLVEVVQRVHLMLNKSDQQGYAEAFAPDTQSAPGSSANHSLARPPR